MRRKAPVSMGCVEAVFPGQPGLARLELYLLQQPNSWIRGFRVQKDKAELRRMPQHGSILCCGIFYFISDILVPVDPVFCIQAFSQVFLPCVLALY